MRDVLIDLTRTCKQYFGNEDGARCAMGALCWDLGIPHDRLVYRSVLMRLSDADRERVLAAVPALRGRTRLFESSFWSDAEWDIEKCYDLMAEFLDYCNWGAAARSSERLIELGHRIGVNFILACPVSFPASKPTPSDSPAAVYAATH